MLSADELRRLLDAVDERWRPLFGVAAETGGRLAEVLGLAWEDVDLDAATITYRVQLDRNGRRVPLKTSRSRRCLEVTPGLASKLRAYKLASAHSSATTSSSAPAKVAGWTTATSAASSSRGP